MKNHPFLIAATAASAGVLLGGFVVMQVLGTPAKNDGDSSARTALNTKAPPHIAETSGAASAGAAAAADCDQQTWPNLTRDCIKNDARGNPTDTQSGAAAKGVAAGTAQPPPTGPTPVKPLAPRPPTPVPATPTTAAASRSPPAAVETPDAMTPASNVAAQPAPEQTAETTPAPEQAAPKAEDKPKAVAKKAKRKAKKPAKPDLNDQDSASFARNETDEQAVRDDRADRWERGDRRYDDPVDRRYDRSRHVSRWIERDNDDGDGPPRRVVVRRGGGNPFGMLFGGFGD